MIRQVCLGDVAEYINGAAFKPSDWESDGRKIIRIQNLNDPTKPYNRTKRIIDKRLHINQGDILVSWSASLGVFVWNDSEEALLNQHIFKVVPNEKLIDKNYLRHCLLQALDSMSKHLHGATMKHINRGEFLSIEIPLPPLEEQQRIAEQLDAADRILRLREASIAKLDQLAQSVFVECMQRFSTTDSLLEDVAEMYQPKTISSNDLVEDGKYVVFGANGIIGRYDQYNHEESEVLVTCRGATCGTINRSEPYSWVTGNAMVVRPLDDSKITKDYLFGYFKYVADFSAVITGAAQPQITRQSLSRLSIKVPNIGSQRLVAESLSHIEEAKKIHLRALTQNNLLLQSLQHQSFSVN